MSKTDSVARILALASGNGGGGGTGGTSNYNDLTNKPSINGVTLQDNKSLGDFGALGINNVVAGDGVSVQTSNNDVVIALGYELATDEDVYNIVYPPTVGAFTLQYKVNDETTTQTLDVAQGQTAYDVLSMNLISNNTKIGEPYELTITSEEPILTSILNLFTNLTYMTKIDISGLDCSNVTDQELTELFAGDIALTTINMSGVSIPAVETFSYTFAELDALTTLNMVGCSFPNTISFDRFIVECPNLTSVQLKLGDMPKLNLITDLIRLCNGLDTLDLSGFDASNASSISRLIIFANNLTNLTLPANISNATVLDSIVRSAPLLTTIDFNGRNNNKLESIQWGFANNTGLQTLDLTMFDFSNVTNMRYMFQNCSSLTEVRVNSTWNASPADKSTVFSGASISNVTIVEV